MNSTLMQGIGFSPLDAIFILAIVLLIVFGIRKNHRLKEEERELNEQIEAFEKKLTEEHSVERTD